jgi:hypothetical protein
MNFVTLRRCEGNLVSQPPYPSKFKAGDVAIATEKISFCDGTEHVPGQRIKLIEENKADFYKELDNLKNPDVFFVAHQFATDGHPKYGHAYWKWAAYKFDGKLYIIEWFPKNDTLDYIIKEVSY